MLEFASTHQQLNADGCDEFEFMMPNAAAACAHGAADKILCKVDDCSLSPADELFYKGQLLPLLLPCRLKMVQELCTSETRASKSEDADLHTNQEKMPCFSPHSVTRFATIAHKDIPCLEESMHTSQEECPGTTVAIAKPRLRWKVLFKRGKKCSLVEAPCCQFTRSGSGIRNEELKVGYIGVGSYASAFHRSGSCNGSPKRPRRTMSALSSSTLIHRTSSINSRSLCRDKGSTSAMREVASTAKAQKESLVLRARDCLQRSFRVLKLARFMDQKGGQHRSNPIKGQQHDYQSVHVTKKRSQVAHCEHRSSNSNSLEDEKEWSDMGTPTKSVACPKEDTYWDLNVSKRSWTSSLFTDGEDDDDHSNAAFITLEPVSSREQCDPLSDSDCPPSCISLTNNCRSHYLDLDDSIQGAIAHCKASA